MFLQSAAQATPPHRYSQSEVWERIKDSPQVQALQGRSSSLLEKVLCGDSGIRSRSFVLPDPLALFSMSAEELNNHYEEQAPRLALASLEKALDEAGVRASDLDALFVCSCTGYLCPGLSSYVSEQSGMRNDSFLQDVNGFGCGAAIPMWRAAQGFLATHPEAVVATVAVEACSLAFFLNDEPGVLISTALFGDGSAAAIWNGGEKAKSGQLKVEHFQTLHQPEEREKIRFVNSGGFLKNQLHRSVPAAVGEAVSTLWDKRSRDPEVVLSHSGGRDVVDVVEKVLSRKIPETRSVLSKYGNCSSPSVVMALAEHLEKGDEKNSYWLTAFGAGFSAHSCELSRLE